MRIGILLVITLVGCATADRSDRATVDAPTPSDSNPAASCTAMVDLLMNGTFDATPVGMGWTGTPANPMYPIITANGLTPHSAPDKAWMGSVVSANDEMHEDVAIPAKAAAVVVAGFYQVHTTETGTTASDTAKVELDDASDAKLETVLTLDNTNAGTTWVAFSHTTTTSVAGRTLRLRFTTTNNATKATSFYFDTLSLQVTSCQ